MLSKFYGLLTVVEGPFIVSCYVFQAANPRFPTTDASFGLPRDEHTSRVCRERCTSVYLKAERSIYRRHMQQLIAGMSGVLRTQIDGRPSCQVMFDALDASKDHEFLVKLIAKNL